MILARLDPAGSPLYFRLVGGAVGLLASVVIASRLLLRAHEHLPGRRALVHWLPIAVATLAAGVMGRFDMAIAIIFGTSVMALSSVSGFVCMAGPMEEAPPRWRPVWMLAPIGALIVFAAGLRGYVGPVEIVVLLVQGAVFLWLWHGEPQGVVGEARVVGLRATGAEGHGGPGPILVALAAIIIAAMAGLSAWLALRAAEGFGQIQPRYPAAAIAATLISMALVIPMVSTGVALAQRSLTGLALTAQMGVVLLNLCALLPAVGILYFAAQRFAKLRELAHMPAVGAAWLVFPEAAGRIDAMVLVILTLMLPPAALGVLRLNRQMGGILIFAYCVYLMTVLVFGGQA